MGVVTRRSSMTFYSDGQDHYSHRARIVLAEKGVSVDVINVTEPNKPEDLADLNPYNSLPTLVDRELVALRNQDHDGVSGRAFSASTAVAGISCGSCSEPTYWRTALSATGARMWTFCWRARVKIRLPQTKARKELRDSLITIAPIFSEKPFFMSDEFTLVDCITAPIFWRLA
jgi:RNA polymerase-associated protein